MGKIRLKERFIQMCGGKKHLSGRQQDNMAEVTGMLAFMLTKKQIGWQIGRDEKGVHLLLKRTVFINKENMELWRSMKAECTRKNYLVQIIVLEK